MQKPHILVVDDDHRILGLLEKFLIKNNYIVTKSESAEDAMEAMKYFIFDLMIVDVMLPKQNGKEFARFVKSISAKTPIILLTALSDIKDKILGFESGANDYMVKPFEPEELIFRIKNLISMVKTQDKIGQTIIFGDCSYNFITKEFVKNSVFVILSSSEQKLLDFFVQNRCEMVSREAISKHLEINERSVDVQVNRLRTKIENDQKNPKFLQTVRSMGYCLYV
jgi:two-component system, OmpR family, phosphate regulon response regulator OmpR